MRAIDLSDQVALILGVANQRSLAWAIADALGQAGCGLVFTHQGERLKKSVTGLAEKYPGAPVIECDVTRADQMDALFAEIGERFGKLDHVIHSVAFAPREDLTGEFRKTSPEGFRIALEISAYSFIDISNRAAPLMKDGGSILGMTYMASQRVIPRYNVMGSAKAALEHSVRQLAYELGPSQIRVNAISAGPVNTVSARGISGFSNMTAHHRDAAPLQRNIEPREVADAALFLCSGMASGITGEVLYVDAGYNIMAF